MITNERQYRVTQAQLRKLTDAAQAFDLATAAKRLGSRTLANAELNALRSEAEELSAQIRYYDELRSGTITIIEADSLDELPSLLIRARIARGLTQFQLADLLGLKEQQIQRYEAENYETASLRRLAEVAKALRLNVREIAELRPENARAR